MIIEQSCPYSSFLFLFISFYLLLSYILPSPSLLHFPSSFLSWPPHGSLKHYLPPFPFCLYEDSGLPKSRLGGDLGCDVLGLGAVRGVGVPRCGSIKNYRQVPHNSTELPPATLLFGRTVKGHWEAFLHTWAYDSANEIVITSSVHVAELKTKMEHGWKLAATNLRQACKKSYLEFQ